MNCVSTRDDCTIVADLLFGNFPAFNGGGGKLLQFEGAVLRQNRVCPTPRETVWTMWKSAAMAGMATATAKGMELRKCMVVSLWRNAKCIGCSEIDTSPYR